MKVDVIKENPVPIPIKEVVITLTQHEARMLKMVVGWNGYNTQTEWVRTFKNFYCNDNSVTNENFKFFTGEIWNALKEV